MGESDSLFVNDIVRIDKYSGTVTGALQGFESIGYGVLVEIDKDSVLVDILDSTLVVLGPVNVVNSKIGTLVFEKAIGYKTDFTRNRLSLKLYRVRPVGNIRELVELADAEHP